jgi:hypothetical protein
MKNITKSTHRTIPNTHNGILCIDIPKATKIVPRINVNIKTIHKYL